MHRMWNQSQTGKVISQLLRNTPGTCFIAYDERLRIQVAEGSDRTFRDISPIEFRGKTLAEVLGYETIEHIKASLEMGLRGKEVSVQFKRKEEEFLLWISPLTLENSEYTGSAAIIQNVTSDKKTERELRRSRKTEMEANRTKSIFLANITHELKTPLNAILGFSEHLLESGLSSEQEKYVEIIRKSSEHLHTLVNEILTLSRLNEESDPKREAFSLREQTEFVFSILSPRARNKELDFTLEINEDVPDYLLGDPLSIREILMNIAGNAIKFTRKGYVKILIEMISDNNKEVTLNFTVADSGIGIEKTHQDSIFDQFSQVDSTITRKYGGTGLGLSITKKLVEMLNGKIKVESAPGEGTRFYITLQMETGDPGEPKKKRDRKIPHRHLTNKKILIVDDDEVNRLLAALTLEKENAKVDLAAEAYTAMNLIKKYSYDLILLDLHMPGISGYSLAGKLRSKGIRVPLLAITAAMPDKKDWVNRFDRLILKPYRKNQLLDTVYELLQGESGAVGPDTETFEPGGEFNLESLKEFSDNDPEMLKKMIHTFIKNTENGLHQLSRSLSSNSEDTMAETAHKLLPSFRHLKAKNIVKDLDYLKNSENEMTPEEKKEVVQNLIEKSRTLIYELKKQV